MSIKHWKLETQKWGETTLEFFAKEDNKFYFGKLSMPEGKTNIMDDGHPNGEHAYCAKGGGTLILHYSDSKKEKIDLKEGNTIFIPENVEHQLITDKNKDIEIIFVVSM